MFDLSAVQTAIQQQGLDGWLLYDFRGLNVLAKRVLGMAGDAILSRRWFYFIPARGEPRKLVHKIEPHALAIRFRTGTVDRVDDRVALQTDNGHRILNHQEANSGVGIAIQRVALASIQAANLHH